MYYLEDIIIVTIISTFLLTVLILYLMLYCLKKIRENKQKKIFENNLVYKTTTEKCSESNNDKPV